MLALAVEMGVRHRGLEPLLVIRVRTEQMGPQAWARTRVRGWELVVVTFLAHTTGLTRGQWISSGTLVVYEILGSSWITSAGPMPAWSRRHAT